MAKGELVIIPILSGSDKDVEAVLVNATFQIKDATTHKYPHPDFGFWLVTEIFEKQKILAKAEGLFKKKFVCSSCHAELNPESQARGTLEFDLKYPFMEFAPFQLRLTLPIVVCENCGKKNVVDVKGVYNNRISEALLRVFEAGHIMP
jgi:hypothetical protein